jgi:hypothetical protein
MGCKKCGASVRALPPPQFAFSTGPDTDNREADVQMLSYINGEIAGQPVELYAMGLYRLNFSLLRLLPLGSFAFRKSAERDLYHATS